MILRKEWEYKMIYGYCRISRKEQSIDRQIRNIKKEYPDALIIQEAFTGTKMDRPEWNKLYGKVAAGDTIVFDSVSRMSRSADEGINIYFKMYESNIELIFLKEHYIDTSVYAENIRDKIELQGTDEDEIFKGLNNYFRKLAERQIRIAFEQAEKEVMDLRQRTKEGIETARLNGKQIGQKPGRVFLVKRKEPIKCIIKKHSRDFGGSLSDSEVMTLAKVSRNTYYKYKRELKNEYIVLNY
ncbi:MAG: recombinase family protein [Lachnospiraceae bacterium]|nr:recombinase family protein [Lachnospiraceae bacterium]